MALLAFVFTDEQKELMIELVKQRPVLYVKERGKSCTKVEKEIVWSEIVEDMKRNDPSLEALTVNVAIQEWTKLRKTLRVVEHRLAKGSGNEPSWRFWKQIQFLRNPVDRTSYEDSEFMEMIKQELSPVAPGDRYISASSPSPDPSTFNHLPQLTRSVPAVQEPQEYTPDGAGVSSDELTFPTEASAQSVAKDSVEPVCFIGEVPPSPPTTSLETTAPRSKRRYVLPVRDTKFSQSTLPVQNTNAIQSKLRKLNSEVQTLKACVKQQESRSTNNLRLDNTAPPTKYRNYALSIEQELLKLTDYQAAVARRDIEMALFNAKYSVPPQPAVSTNHIG